MSDVKRKKPRITEFGPCHDEMQELESLRQRVKELEEKCRGHAQIEVALREELAALKGITAFAPNNAASNVQSGALKTAPTIPEGYVMVPVKPTPEMIEAGRPMTEGDYSLPYHLWKFMLAAAPKPEESK